MTFKPTMYKFEFSLTAEQSELLNEVFSTHYAYTCERVTEALLKIQDTPSESQLQYSLIASLERLKLDNDSLRELVMNSCTEPEEK